jgi:hypothetical protein
MNFARLATTGTNTSSAAMISSQSFRPFDESHNDQNEGMLKKGLSAKGSAAPLRSE